MVHATCGHALVHSVDVDSHAARFERISNRFCDLSGHGFLGLQTLGEDFHHARDFRDPHHPIGGHVGHMGFAEERGHVVFAMALHIDIAQHHDIVIARNILKHPGEFFFRIGLIALEPFCECIHNAFGRVLETFAVRIVTGPSQQGAHCSFGVGARRSFRLRFGHEFDRSCLAILLLFLRAIPLARRRRRRTLYIR